MPRDHYGSGSSDRDSTPADFGGAVPPQYITTPDHSFTLQAIMDLQKANGQLTSNVENLSKNFEKLDGKLDKLTESVSSLSHKVYAAGVVLAILLTVSGLRSINHGLW